MMKEYLRALFGMYENRAGQFLELRACRPLWNGGGVAERRFFPLTRRGVALTIQTLERWNRQRLEAYIGVLPRTGRNGTKEGITQAGFAWTDIDPGEAGAEAALGLLKASIPRLGLPIPDMVVKSGGGYHVYWGLANVITLSTMEERRDVEALLRRIVEAIGGSEPKPHADRNCAEVARVLRPAGTFNNKIKENPRPVELAHCDLRRALTIEEWKRLLPAPSPAALREPLSPIAPDDLRGYAGLVNWSREPIPEGQRHGRLVAAAKWLIKDVGVPFPVAYDLLQQKASVSYGSHPVTERELKEIFKWAQR